MDGKVDREVLRGFSLLETLITVLVLSLGLLGLAALQVASVRDTQSAYLKNQAVNRSYQILDLMRANGAAARGGAYEDAFSQGADSYCGAGDADAARSDLCAWERALSETLPDGAGSVAVDGGVATVCVRWAEPQRSNDVRTGACDAATADATERLFRLRVVL